MIGRDRACVAGISLSLVERRDRLRETSFSPGRKEDLPPFHDTETLSSLVLIFCCGPT